MKKKYNLNKSKKVGDECICPSCGAKFIKTHYQQAFCRTKGKTVCKDKYWNTVTPHKRNNTTRISPASAAWLEKQARDKGFPDFETMKEYIPEDDGCWDAHQCHVEPCEFCGLLPEFCECEHC